MQQETRRKQGRRIAVIIAATGLGWIAIQVLGAALGLSQRFMVLFDMLAGVGFVMALWLSYQMRQGAQSDKQTGNGQTDKD